jgi:SAM-dependent methyltransferase
MGEEQHDRHTGGDSSPTLRVPPGVRMRGPRRALERLLRPILAQQAGLNRRVLDELRSLDERSAHDRALLDGVLADTVRVLESGLAETRDRLGEVAELCGRHGVALQNLAHAGRQLADLDGAVRAMQDTITHHHHVLERQDIALEHHSTVVERIDAGLETDVKRTTEDVARLGALIELVQQQAMSRVQDEVGSLQSQLNELERAAGEIARLRSDVDDLGRAKDAWLAQGTSLWPRLAQLELFVDDAKRSVAGSPHVEHRAEPATDLPAPLDALYPALEDAFRGPFEVIKDRLNCYVDDLAAASKLGPVVDLGSGRGELLSLLQERGVDAYGVELAQRAVEASRARGMDVVHDDALVHLRDVVPGSLGAVSMIHLVEHLKHADVIRLLDLSFRALSPGGLLIIESPNPENLVVGASTFYLDPTHRRPVPPQLLAFLVAARGFGEVEVRRLEREARESLGRPAVVDRTSPEVARLLELVESWLTAPQDYAVVARRLG